MSSGEAEWEGGLPRARSPHDGMPAYTKSIVGNEMPGGNEGHAAATVLITPRIFIFTPFWVIYPYSLTTDLVALPLL